MRTAHWAFQRRFLITVVGAVVATAAWTGSATAGPVFRQVAFDDTYSFDNSPFCGDDVIVVHDVGRITTTVFVQPDGTFRLSIHDAAITSTITDTRTGATLTGFYSNFEAVQQKTDPVTGAITEKLTFTGLNFIFPTSGPAPAVSAGRAVETLLITFDAQGNPTVTLIGGTATPNMQHVTQVLCAP